MESVMVLEKSLIELEREFRLRNDDGVLLAWCAVNLENEPGADALLVDGQTSRLASCEAAKTESMRRPDMLENRWD